MTGSADIVVGLGWGDEGKGATTDFLAHHTHANRVVRFNGGQQAAHNVVVGGKHHTFASYGSGTLSGVPTYISKFCTIDPFAALRERNVLLSNFPDIMNGRASVLRVHQDCKVTTPLNIVANHRAETSRGEDRHGSTGTGFGETVSWEVFGRDPLRIKHFNDPNLVCEYLFEYRKEMDLSHVFSDSDIQELSRKYTTTLIQETGFIRVVSDEEFLHQIREGHTIFEGAQGFFLDEVFGTSPHTTWSTTTPRNARQLCLDAGIYPFDIRTWGVLRTYATRHGHGPFPGEGLVRVPEPHNSTTEWAGDFRTGAWNLDLLTWALKVTGVDRLSLTWADRFDKLQTTEGEVEFGDLGVPVRMTSNGPSRSNRTLHL